MKLLILFCQLNNKLTIDLKQEIVKATLVKTLLDKIPSYLYSRTILPTIQQVCGASKKYEVTACKLSFRLLSVNFLL